MARSQYLPAQEPGTDWQRNKRLVRLGFRDLAYLPAPRTGWNMTLAALAYSARRALGTGADLNLWAAAHACTPSSRYTELGRHALVLWHGTSAKRADKIREVGLFHKRGLWTTLEPKIAHGFTRSRSGAFQVGSAMIVILLDRREVEAGQHYDLDSEEVYRFHAGLPPDCVEYILWDDRIEFLGDRRTREPNRWGVARFRKREGRWEPRSRAPVRFDDTRAYDGLQAWLELSIRRILATFDYAAAIEVFSSLYATVEPWDALAHDDVLDALERLCTPPRRRAGYQTFALRDR